MKDEVIKTVPWLKIQQEFTLINGCVKLLTASVRNHSISHDFIRMKCNKSAILMRKTSFLENEMERRTMKICHVLVKKVKNSKHDETFRSLALHLSRFVDFSWLSVWKHLLKWLYLHIWSCDLCNIRNYRFISVTDATAHGQGAFGKWDVRKSNKFLAAIQPQWHAMGFHRHRRHVYAAEIKKQLQWSKIQSFTLVTLNCPVDITYTLMHYRILLYIRVKAGNKGWFMDRKLPVQRSVRWEAEVGVDQSESDGRKTANTAAWVHGVSVPDLSLKSSGKRSHLG